MVHHALVAFYLSNKIYFWSSEGIAHQLIVGNRLRRSGSWLWVDVALVEYTAEHRVEATAKQKYRADLSAELSRVIVWWSIRRIFSQKKAAEHSALSKRRRH